MAQGSEQRKRTSIRCGQTPVVVVVGPGRVGRTLALAEHRHGGAPVLLIGWRAGAWMRWARRNGLRAWVDDGGAGPEGLGGTERILLTVPDDRLEEVAADWAFRWRGARSGGASRRCWVVHCSGYHDLRPLRPWRGARRAAVHPILPFTTPALSLRRLHGAVATVLASSADLRGARALARAWGARPLSFPPGVDRRRYHLGLSLAANSLTALLAWSTELLQPSLGARAAPVALALATAALEASRALGPERALTGPVVRGDLAILRGHLTALAPSQRPAYRALLERTLHLAEESGRLSHAHARALRRELRP